MRILVTGATGYIGGRLVTRLLAAGHDVRVLVRNPDRVRGRAWAGRVEVVKGDLLQPETLPDALAGMDTAYYLVHSMYGGADYEQRDRDAAQHFVAAAKGVKHTIYLGGLVPEGDRISTHLRSRAEVGEILRKGLPTTEFRAGPIIGSGSASFEMVRYLTERLPYMIAPKWVRNDVQPISVRDMLDYLVQALDQEPLGVVEVGADAQTFRDMMHIYATVRGLRRRILSVPVFAPGLAARWVGLVTPIPNTLAVPLVRGVICPLRADTRRATEVFPSIKPISYREAVEAALRKTVENDVETRWSGALSSAETYEVRDWEGVIREVRSVNIDTPCENVFDSFTGLGGAVGWGRWDWAWELRGFFDRICGGPGLRRGRRDAARVLPGESLDFWRVEEVEKPRLLRLRAEMKVPGKAWLQWEAHAEGEGTRLVQTAFFEPTGLGGALYWYSLYPFHRFIFSDLANFVAKRAKSA